MENPEPFSRYSLQPSDHCAVWILSYSITSYVDSILSHLSGSDFYIAEGKGNVYDYTSSLS